MLKLLLIRFETESIQDLKDDRYVSTNSVIFNCDVRSCSQFAILTNEANCQRPAQLLKSVVYSGLQPSLNDLHLVLLGLFLGNFGFNQEALFTI